MLVNMKMKKRMVSLFMIILIATSISMGCFESKPKDTSNYFSAKVGNEIANEIALEHNDKSILTYVSEYRSTDVNGNAKGWRYQYSLVFG